MRKILIVSALAAILCAALSGCGAADKNETPMEKIQERLNGLQSYHATGTVTRITDEGESEYGIEQYYKISGQYRLELTSPDEVAGNYTVYDGSTVCQFNPRVKGKIIKNVPENQARNELFIGCFVKNYMNSEGVSIAVANFDESQCTVLEAVIPGSNKFTSTEKLWIDNETLDPVKLVIYDSEGKERYILQFKQFEYNAQIDDSVFSVEGVSPEGQ